MKFLYTILLILAGCFATAQTHLEINQTAEELGLWTKNTVPLASDSNCSAFAIRVKEEVKAHYHAFHTENLYVLKGKAQMLLGDSIILIKAGDFINIPPKTIHSVKVTSLEWLEVISIQSPEFKGDDRILIEEKP